MEYNANILFFVYFVFYVFILDVKINFLLLFPYSKKLKEVVQYVLMF